MNRFRIIEGDIPDGGFYRSSGRVESQLKLVRLQLEIIQWSHPVGLGHRKGPDGQPSRRSQVGQQQGSTHPRGNDPHPFGFRAQNQAGGGAADRHRYRVRGLLELEAAVDGGGNIPDFQGQLNGSAE